MWLLLVVLLSCLDQAAFVAEIECWTGTPYVEGVVKGPPVVERGPGSACETFIASKVKPCKMETVMLMLGRVYKEPGFSYGPLGSSIGDVCNETRCNHPRVLYDKLVNANWTTASTALDIRQCGIDMFENALHLARSTFPTTTEATTTTTDAIAIEIDVQGAISTTAGVTSTMTEAIPSSEAISTTTGAISITTKVLTPTKNTQTTTTTVVSDPTTEEPISYGSYDIPHENVKQREECNYDGTIETSTVKTVGAVLGILNGLLLLIIIWFIWTFYKIRKTIKDLDAELHFLFREQDQVKNELTRRKDEFIKASKVQESSSTTTISKLKK